MNKLEEYILRYQNLHDGTDPYLAGNTSYVNGGAGNKTIFDGSQLGKKLPPFIQQLIDYKQRAITLLDYGCGKAVHVHQPLKEHGNKTLLGRLNGMLQCYYCYDPAVKIYNVKPPEGMVFDLVCCADVMEHIPEDFVGSVINEIANYTKHDGTAMFTISGNPAKKSFVDGENLHATIKPVDWWVDQLKLAFRGKSFIMFYNDESKPEEPINVRYHNSEHNAVWKFKEKNFVVNNYACVSEEV